MNAFFLENSILDFYNSYYLKKIAKRLQTKFLKVLITKQKSILSEVFYFLHILYFGKNKKR